MGKKRVDLRGSLKQWCWVRGVIEGHWGHGNVRAVGGKRMILRGLVSSCVAVVFIKHNKLGH